MKAHLLVGGWMGVCVFTWERRLEHADDGGSLSEQSVRFFLLFSSHHLIFSSCYCDCDFLHYDCNHK